jgi:CRP/FNR family cyclic AMP-dependent transcriptional regulator
MDIASRGKYSIEQIKGLPIFNQLDEPDIADMLKQSDVIRIMSYTPGEKMITEGNLDRKMFLIVKGKVKISKDVFFEDTRECKEIKTIEGSGHFLGEISALTGEPRTASVTALIETVCVVINIDLLLRTSSGLVERVKDSLYPKLFELVCKRLGDTNERLVTLKQKNENLERKVSQLLRDKISLNVEYQKQLRKKNREIHRLESELEELKGIK